MGNDHFLPQEGAHNQPTLGQVPFDMSGNTVSPTNVKTKKPTSQKRRHGSEAIVWAHSILHHLETTVLRVMKQSFKNTSDVTIKR
jgi:hypothetical protein